MANAFTGQSAIAIVIKGCDALDKLRKEYDSQYIRWPPHINLCHPFLSSKEEKKVVEIITPIVAKFPITLIKLSEFGYFKAPKGSTCTVFLKPNIETFWSTIQKEIVTELKLPASRHVWTPHITFGKCTTVRKAEELIAKVKATWIPVEVAVSSLSWLVREELTPFKEFVSFSLVSGIASGEVKELKELKELKEDMIIPS